jgi:hypothetical protein
MATPEQRRAPAPALWLTVIVTSLTKLAGLAIGFNEALLRTELRPSALGLAAFMMAGAQVSEPVLLSMVDRLFGTTTAKKGKRAE